MNFLTWLIATSLAGTFVLLILLSLKPLTQRLFSKTWHYYTSFITVFFFIGGAGLLNNAIQFFRSHFGNASVAPPVATTVNQLASPALQTEAISAASDPSFAGQLLSSISEHIRTFAVLLTVIWAIGAILFVAVNVYKYRKYRRLLLQNSRRCFSIRCAIPIRVSNYADTPMLVGFFKPIIVLPDMKFSEKELDVILAHELTHFRRKDVLVKFIILLVNAAHWFNPAVYVLNKQINALCELSCDEKVVKGMDESNRKFYGEMILAMLRHGNVQRNLICTSGLCNSKKNIKRRLTNIISTKKTRKSIVALSIIATMTVLMIGSAAAAVIDFTFPDEILAEVEIEITAEEVYTPIAPTEPTEWCNTEEVDTDVAEPPTTEDISAATPAEPFETVNNAVPVEPVTSEIAEVPTETPEPAANNETIMETPEEPSDNTPRPSVSNRRIEDIIMEQLNEMRN